MPIDVAEEDRSAARERMGNPGGNKPLGKKVGNREIPDFSVGLLTTEALVNQELPERLTLLGRWMRKGDLGYIFAPRGAGKSWMAMLVADAVASGRPLGEWGAGEQSAPAYYFDAEMNLADLQQRVRMLGIGSGSFFLLSNERLLEEIGHGVNIADASHQEALSKLLPDGALFVIDNLSTSQLGMKENDNDSFDLIRDWLLGLRLRGVTVMIVHHAGRSGAMRGSSRREDMAHWIISLKSAGDAEEGQTSFTTSFTPPGGKCRNCQGGEVKPLRWDLVQHGDGLKVECVLFSGKDSMLQHISDGVGSATELAELLGVTKGTVSKWAKRLKDDGLIRIDNRDYVSINDDSGY